LENKFSSKKKFIFLLSAFFLTLQLASQDVANKIHPPPKLQTDLFGRSYFLKWDGAIEFSVDDSYKEAMPDSSQLEIHMGEAKALIEKRKVFPAIRLLKGLALCERMRNQSKKVFNPEAQKTLNKLLSQEQDKREELEILTEPYGCYTKNQKGIRKLFIESKDFGFFYELDERFKYVFPTDLYRFARKEKEYNWKVSYFRIFLPQAKKEESFETEYFRYENQIFYESPAKIVLSIGQTYHIHSQNKEMYPFVWDARRGLSESVKKGTNFIRKEFQSGYETSFYLTENHEIKSFVGFEKYRFHKNKGLGIFLVCPSEWKEDCNKIWREVESQK